MSLYSWLYFFDNFSLKLMAWVPCGILLQKEMPPYSNLTTANNLIWNLFALRFQTVYDCKIPPPPPLGRRVSLAGPRTIKANMFLHIN